MVSKRLTAAHMLCCNFAHAACTLKSWLRGHLVLDNVREGYDRASVMQAP